MVSCPVGPFLTLAHQIQEIVVMSKVNTINVS
jgi:hypothetical protein